MVDLNIELPEGFLDEEVRCGYTVTRQMKEVWAVELDLLKKFETVCNKYHLTYTGSGGTMLGTIRHKGFIPWDDDIDIDMPRSDYNKLCNVAEKEFSDIYFLQTEYTDKGSLRGHAQLRRSDTTAILNSEKGIEKFNQGIFLDIFPQDNIPDDQNELNEYVETILKYKNKYSKISRWCNPNIIPQNPYKSLIKKVCRPALFILDKIDVAGKFYKKADVYAQSYDEIQTNRIASALFIPDKDRHRYSSKYLLETIEVPFEFTTIKISKIYDEILHQMYGDYMKIVKGGSLHGDTFFDTSRSYKDYI